MKLLVRRSICGPVCKGLTEATFEAVDFYGLSPTSCAQD